jgi:hypothetical protein
VKFTIAKSRSERQRDPKYVRVQALDSSAKVLGSSKVVKPRATSPALAAAGRCYW